jgi:hypothetical protein
MIAQARTGLSQSAQISALRALIGRALSAQRPQRRRSNALTGYNRALGPRPRHLRSRRREEFGPVGAGGIDGAAERHGMQ